MPPVIDKLDGLQPPIQGLAAERQWLATINWARRDASQNSHPHLATLQNGSHSSEPPSTRESVDEAPGRSPSLFARLSPQTLPQLRIPLSIESNVNLLHASPPITPATPASLSSPVTGVIDLTQNIKTVHDSPITTGGFSDIYKGVWVVESLEKVNDEEENGSPQGSMEKKKIVQVAIKLLRVLAVKDAQGAKARKRLNREVYVWHRLEHPNIAKLFGTSYHMSGRPSMVMKWYDNGSAVDYLKDKGPEVDRMALILDVARGLKYLHTFPPNPIIHGDLKGNNVLIDDDGRAVLSDFGLSKVIEDLVGPTGYTPSNVGPLRWQAPEFVEDESCQPGLQTDIWSFGCTAYELLTGKIPYYYRTRDGMVIKDMQSRIKPPGPDCSTLDSQDTRINDLLHSCCWSFIPAERLQIADIVLQVENICKDLKCLT